MSIFSIHIYTEEEDRFLTLVQKTCRDLLLSSAPDFFIQLRSNPREMISRFKRYKAPASFQLIQESASLFDIIQQQLEALFFLHLILLMEEAGTASL